LDRTAGEEGRDLATKFEVALIISNNFVLASDLGELLPELVAGAGFYNVDFEAVLDAQRLSELRVRGGDVVESPFYKPFSDLIDLSGDLAIPLSGDGAGDLLRLFRVESLLYDIPLRGEGEYPDEGLLDVCARQIGRLVAASVIAASFLNIIGN
jgi:hypothetical protein